MMVAKLVVLLAALAFAAGAEDCEASFNKLINKYEGACKEATKFVVIGPELNGEPSDDALQCPDQAVATKCFAERSGEWEKLSAECQAKASKTVCMGAYGVTQFFDWVNGACSTKLAETFDKVKAANLSDTCRDTLNATLNVDDLKDCPLSADVKTCFKANQDTWVALVEECPATFSGAKCLKNFNSVGEFAAFVDTAPPPENAAAAVGGMLSAAAAAVAAAFLLA